jgi:hypothetical protein
VYQIFIVTNVAFGEISKLEYNDKEIANSVWKEIVETGCPVIFVENNKIKISNAKMTHQPKFIYKDEWPLWVQKCHEADMCTTLSSYVIEHDFIGCCEFQQTYKEQHGMKKVVRTFFTYKGDRMFTVIEYN